jgi:hypothetical protein
MSIEPGFPSDLALRQNYAASAMIALTRRPRVCARACTSLSGRAQPFIRLHFGISPPLARIYQKLARHQRCGLGARLGVATSVGGVLTGRGADIIVIDDPLKHEEALSQTQRQAANEWYDHTLYSRLNDKLSVRSC